MPRTATRQVAKKKPLEAALTLNIEPSAKYPAKARKTSKVKVKVS